MRQLHRLSVTSGQGSGHLFAGLISYTVLNSFALAALALPIQPAQLSSPIASGTIQANSNRIPAGELENGVLTLHLELREGEWYPEAEGGPSLKVYAFAEEGKAPQVPGL
jgi:hypothetical protein